MTSRRAMLTAMGGLPFARPDQHYEPPDGAIVPGTRSGVLRAKLIIISGTAPATGLFAYSPKPGAGNLVASIIPGGSIITDPYGNKVVPGVAEYTTNATGPPVFAVSLLSGQVAFFNATTQAGPWSISQPEMNGDTAGNLNLAAASSLQQVQITLGALAAQHGLSVTGGETADTIAVSSGQLGGLMLAVTNTTGGPTAPNMRITSQTAGDPALGIRVAGDSFNRVLLDDNGTTGGRLRAGSGVAALDVSLFRAAANQWAADYLAFNNAGAAETWQAPTFANSWANSGAPGANLQYRRNSAPFKTVSWVGRVTAPAGVVAGQQMITAVPAAYRPASTQKVAAINVTTGGAVRVTIGSTGILTFQSGMVAADVADLGDLIYLDA